MIESRGFKPKAQEPGGCVFAQSISALFGKGQLIIGGGEIEDSVLTRSQPSWNLNGLRWGYHSLGRLTLQF